MLARPGSAMAKDKDLLSKRLASIKTAKPVDWTPPPAKERPKRAEERKPAFRFARVILPDRSEIRCIIKDVTSKGAKIVLEGQNPLPKRVRLRVEQTGQTVNAAVVWQKELEVGLAFEH